MKKNLKMLLRVLVLMVVFFFVVGSDSCSNSNQQPSKAEAILIGSHELGEEMKIEIEMIPYGSADSGEKPIILQPFLVFSWKMNDQRTWAWSRLPLEKIRISCDDNVPAPNVRFRWQKVDLFESLQELFQENVVYALFVMSTKDKDEFKKRVSIVFGNTIETKVEELPGK